VRSSRACNLFRARQSDLEFARQAVGQLLVEKRNAMVPGGRLHVETSSSSNPLNGQGGDIERVVAASRVVSGTPLQHIAAALATRSRGDAAKLLLDVLPRL